MGIKWWKSLLLLVLVCVSTACAQPISRGLNIVIKDQNLCIYTDHAQTFQSADQSFIVYISKIKAHQADQVIYSKAYSHTDFPIRQQQCLSVPMQHLKLNQLYEVNLESNKIFSQRFCFTQQQGKRQINLISTQKHCDTD